MISTNFNTILIIQQFAILLLAAVVAMASAQYVSYGGLGYGAYPAYTGAYSYGAYPAYGYSGLGYGGLAYYKK